MVEGHGCQTNPWPSPPPLTYQPVTSPAQLLGELEKMTQVLQTWISEFPRDGSPHGSLGFNYLMLGQFSKALPELQEAARLSVDDVANYENLATLHLVMGEPTKATAILDAARARGLDSAGLRELLYELAFIENDEASGDVSRVSARTSLCPSRRHARRRNRIPKGHRATGPDAQFLIGGASASWIT